MHIFRSVQTAASGGQTERVKSRLKSSHWSGAPHASLRQQPRHRHYRGPKCYVQWCFMSDRPSLAPFGENRTRPPGAIGEYGPFTAPQSAHCATPWILPHSNTFCHFFFGSSWLETTSREHTWVHKCPFHCGSPGRDRWGLRFEDGGRTEGRRFSETTKRQAVMKEHSQNFLLCKVYGAALEAADQKCVQCRTCIADCQLSWFWHKRKFGRPTDNLEWKKKTKNARAN